MLMSGRIFPIILEKGQGFPGHRILTFMVTSELPWPP